MEILTIVLSAGASAISGLVLFYLQRFFRERDKQEQVTRKVKEKESILILKSINAIGKLTEANAIALRDKRTNGELKHALSAYEKADKEMYQYLLEQNAHK